MTTIRDKLLQLCIDNGLWPEEADAVMASVESSVGEDMKHRWNDYPPQMLAVLWMTTRLEAVKYIDANKPRHFARPMFAFDPPKSDRAESTGQ